MKFTIAVVLGVLALACVASCAVVDPLHVDSERLLWNAWKSAHSKSYAHSLEENKRFNIFRDNLQKIRQHNAEAHSHTLAMNKFGDLTTEEFKAVYLSRPMPERTVAPGGVFTATGAPVLRDVNWVTAGKVNPVKDQGQCGSCWAFSATASIESAWAIAGHPLVSLSEQQLVDCDSQSQGCNGGLMDNGFQSVISSGGQELESQYPYTATQGSCQYNGQAAAKISSYQDINSDINSLQAALNRGPVSIAIDAETLQFYSSGVIQPSSCGTNLDHGVVAVGYTADSILVRNSWSASWGMNGYFYLSSSGNTCGMLQAMSQPIV